MTAFVSRIESNLKGVASPLMLGPRTYVVGENASGKTGVLQSIELALTGSVADIGGQSEPRRESNYLMRLAPGRKGVLFAEATLSTGERFRTEIKGSSASAHKPDFTGPSRLAYDAIFPARWMAETLVRSTATVRQSVLDSIGRGLTFARLRELLPEMPEIEEVPGIPAIQILGSFRADLARQLSNARAQAGQIETEAQSRASVLTPLPDIALLAQEAAAAEAASVRAEATVVEIGASPAAELLDAMAQVQKVVTLNQGRHVCLACKGATTPAETMARLAEVNAAIAGVESQHGAWDRQRQAAIGVRFQASSALSAARARLETARQFAAERRAVETKAARSSRDRLLELQHLASRLERRIADCDAAFERVLAGGAEEFRSRVQTAYGADGEVGVSLRDGKREVFEVGLLRDGVLHTALSGAEWARLSAAVAAAIESPSPVRILVPADRAMTPHTMGLVQDALAQAVEKGMVSQVILQNVISSQRSGWTVVKV